MEFLHDMNALERTTRVTWKDWWIDSEKEIRRKITPGKQRA
jgi:hypothetical protein